MLVDSHCHLDFEELQTDFTGVLKRAKNAGVLTLQTICVKISKFQSILDIACRADNIYCSVGIHPSNVKEEGVSTAEAIAEYCTHYKVIGIGETGLDYYRGTADRDLQIQSFIQHIKAAQKTGLPIIVHTRNAEHDTVAILLEHMKQQPFTGVIHCFTASHWLAEECLKMGLYISASGIITFKNAKDIQDSFKKIPLNRILIETDAPYLAPAPLRGKCNEPAFVKHTAEFLADLRDISYEQLAMATTENFFNLFNKAKQP